MRSKLLILVLHLCSPISALKIATSLQWIEHTPQPFAIKNFYKGSSKATLSSGGVANLGTDTSFDLAANAETQGLKQYANHRNIRLIYMICEVSYRIVANKAAGIRELKDLKGKRIGTISGTSAGVFVQRMMSSVGVKENEYTIVGGNVCMKSPCGTNTFPSMIATKQIDAFGIWEPAVELGANALGENAILFQNGSIYREMYALYSTTDKLNDPSKRKDIVAFVGALNQTLEIFRKNPESVYEFVGGAVGSDANVIKSVWEDHKWSGRWGEDLINLLFEEDKLLASQDRRSAASKTDLQKFLDASVMDEL